MMDERQPDAVDPAVDPSVDVPADIAIDIVVDSSAVTSASLGDVDTGLLALIDRLAGLLERSDLTELEVEVGGTGLVLRKPSALAPVGGANPGPAGDPAIGGPTVAAARSGGDGSTDAALPERPSIKAPLTGIFYASPAPGSAPYVHVGGEVAVGQVIGLIEAMKLFNEIKSDLAGRVTKVVPDSGTLVKAKQPLIEVEPL
jgi:acetyl-CoA carboxylase biotin carboxyl carrier protein